MPASLLSATTAVHAKITNRTTTRCKDPNPPEAHRFSYNPVQIPQIVTEIT